MTNSAAILVVDDNPIVHESIRAVLEPEGFQLFSAYNGMEALKLVESIELDLVLLDIMMPGMDGFQVCAELRKRKRTPIMMVSALDDAQCIELAYSLGADDYLCQPYGGSGLLTRIPDILQRNSIDSEHSSLPPEISAKIQNEGIALTRIEARLLSMLANTPGQPHGKADIFRYVWGYDAPEGQVLVDAAVRQMREKLEGNGANPAYIRSVAEDCYVFSSRQ